MSLNMKIKDLLDKLGVGHALGPYQTAPWSCYDSDRGLTCSAEVRMGPDNEELEAEAQMVHDVPPDGGHGMEQICYIRLKPASSGQWNVQTARIRGKVVDEKTTPGFEQKCCAFFGLLVQSLKMNTIPNVDEAYEEVFGGKDRFGGGSSAGGGKSPKIKAGQVLGMKKGRGF